MYFSGLFNPLPAIVLFIGRSANILISILEGIINKSSYERLDYESVDEKTLWYLIGFPDKIPWGQNPM